MIGRIKTLNGGNAGGVIKAENGLSIAFELCDVLAYDVLSLAVGRMVSFELAAGNVHSAVNVCVETVHRAPHIAEKGTEGLRYMGFQQSGSTRSYRFEQNSAEEGCGMFIVTTDLELFTKHHVRIQDGPALCLRLIMSMLAEGAPEKSETHLSLTEQDLLAHAEVASSILLAMKSRPRRGPLHTSQRFASGFALPLTGPVGH